MSQKSNVSLFTLNNTVVNDGPKMLVAHTTKAFLTHCHGYCRLASRPCHSVPQTIEAQALLLLRQREDRMQPRDALLPHTLPGPEPVTGLSLSHPEEMLPGTTEQATTL